MQKLYVLKRHDWNLWSNPVAIYDMDGVIVEQLSKPKWREMGHLGTILFLLTRKLRFKPKGSFIILTARSDKYAWVTRLWMWLHGVKPVSISVMTHKSPYWTADDRVLYKKLVLIQISAQIRDRVIRYYDDEEYMREGLKEGLQEYKNIVILDQNDAIAHDIMADWPTNSRE